MFKLPKIKIPKVKMPNVMGKAKDLTKKVTSEVSSKTKAAGQGIKNLNPFKK
jgi:hypothetical protein